MPRTLDKSDVAKKTATETITTKTVAVPARKPAPFVRWIAWILGFGLVVAAAGIIAYVLDDAATQPTAPALSDIDPHESPEAFRDLHITGTRPPITSPEAVRDLHITGP